MDQLYFDGMTICTTVGFLDFFLTFTCNPYWPEIQRSISALKLAAQDQPDIVRRVFKLKLEQLMSNLKDRKVLRNVLACKLSIPNALSAKLTIACIVVINLSIFQLQIFTQLNSKREVCHMLISCCFWMCQQVSISCGYWWHHIIWDTKFYWTTTTLWVCQETYDAWFMWSCE